MSLGSARAHHALRRERARAAHLGLAGDRHRGPEAEHRLLRVHGDDPGDPLVLEVPRRHDAGAESLVPPVRHWHVTSAPGGLQGSLSLSDRAPGTHQIQGSRERP